MKPEFKSLIAFAILIIVIEASFYFSMSIDIPFGDFSILRWVIGTLLALIFLLLGKMTINGKIGVGSVWLLFSLVEFNL